MEYLSTRTWALTPRTFSRNWAWKPPVTLITVSQRGDAEGDAEDGERGADRDEGALLRAEVAQRDDHRVK